MTNTRITDPEILERRYPVILRQFSIRKDSGGDGLFRGGDGVIRELEFTRPLTVSILSERRAFQPYGMGGGCPGARGLNLLRMAKDKRVINLGGKNTVLTETGDTLIIHSPGGGGYGKSVGKRNSGEEKKLEINPSHHELFLKQYSMKSGSLNQYTMNQESV